MYPYKKESREIKSLEGNFEVHFLQSLDFGNKYLKILGPNDRNVEETLFKTHIQNTTHFPKSFFENSS